MYLNSFEEKKKRRKRKRILHKVIKLFLKGVGGEKIFYIHKGSLLEHKDIMMFLL